MFLSLEYQHKNNLFGILLCITCIMILITILPTSDHHSLHNSLVVAMSQARGAASYLPDSVMQDYCRVQATLPLLVIAAFLLGTAGYLGQVAVIRAPPAILIHLCWALRIAKPLKRMVLRNSQTGKSWMLQT